MEGDINGIYFTLKLYVACADVKKNKWLGVDSWTLLGEFKSYQVHIVKISK